MSAMLESAKLFFDACETGKGWEACMAYCQPGATFSAQAGALAEINTLDGYCEWMKGFFTPVPDAHYELKFFAADENRKIVTAVDHQVVVRIDRWSGAQGEPLNVRDHRDPGVECPGGVRQGLNFESSDVGCSV